MQQNIPQHCLGLGLAVWLGLAAGMATAAWGADARDAFYASPPQAGAKLPAEGFYPHGQKLVFMGYSGDPGRDLTNGFTAAGLVYGDQMPFLERCFSNHWPVAAHIGPNITFKDGDPKKYKLNEGPLREEVARQIKALAAHQEILWWTVKPEELRPWRKEEMQYLAIVCDTIRKNDPLKRPIFHYNPNNRDAVTLGAMAKELDVLGKGCYVNLSGHKRDRAWVRWSVEQECQALRASGRLGGIALVMPELCRDPEPAEERDIRAWVRHDVYLGLASGAKGVLVWSLFKRKEVKHSWPLWYDAYAECGRELNGSRNLGQVFLFGERRSNLRAAILKGAAELTVPLGGHVESTTTNPQEQNARQVKLPAVTIAEYAYQEARWLFLINSANTPATVAVSGWPSGSRAENAFDGAKIELPAKTPLPIELPPCGVAAVRFSAERKE